MTQDATISAFRHDWERLGVVAGRLGFRTGQKLVKHAQMLREQGAVESHFDGACLVWRLASGQREAPTADIRVPPPPPKLTPYCPPPELEGPHSGLVEQMAHRLWSKARRFSPTAMALAPDADWATRPENVKEAWREVAYDSLMMLFDMGFIGPAGKPDAERFEGLTYCWNYVASEWQINDAEGGYVALVRETPDLEMMLAAPAMRSAIKGLLGLVPSGHPWRYRPELRALETSLPENAAAGERLGNTKTALKPC